MAVVNESGLMTVDEARSLRDYAVAIEAIGVAPGSTDPDDAPAPAIDVTARGGPA